MLREHVINFLEAAVVLLMLTNAFSIGLAAYALALMQPRTDSRAAAVALPASLGRWLRTTRPTR